MTLSTGPNLGLFVNGAKGEAHYDTLMRFLRGLDTLVQPRVSSMVGALPSTGLVDGLTVLYTANDTNKDRLARYSVTLAGWEYFAPRPGWEIAVVDQLDENGQFKKYQYTGSAWVEKLTAGGLTLATGDARYERLLKHNLTATTDPTVNDDSADGYGVLSRWVNTTTKEAFLAMDVAPGVANWQKSTLTVDELGSAALATVGLLDANIPTVATVKNLLATLAVFDAGSAVSAGTKGLVPAPPQSEVLRFLRSDGVWAFFEVPDGVQLSTGANIGEGVGTAGLYFQTVGPTLQFRSIKAADDSIELQVTDSQILIKAKNVTPEPVSIGTGSSLLAGTDVDGSQQFRSVRGGDNVNVTIEGDTLVVSSTGGSGTGGGTARAKDTGWLDVSTYPDNPDPSFSASGAQVRKVGNMVHMRGTLWIPSLATGGQLFTLPTGFAPSQQVVLRLIQSGYSRNPGVLSIDPDGTVGTIQVNYDEYMWLDDAHYIVDGPFEIEGVSAGGRELANLGGGVPLYAGVVNEKHAIQSLIPAGGISLLPSYAGGVFIAAKTPVWQPSVAMFLVDNADGEEQWMVSSTAGAYLESRGWDSYTRHEVSSGLSDDGDVQVLRYREVVEVSSIGEAGPIAFGLYLPVEGDVEVYVYLEELTAVDGTPGMFSFSQADVNEPGVVTNTVMFGQGTGLSSNLSFSLQQGSNLNMLRVSPPEGCEEYYVAMRVEVSRESPSGGELKQSIHATTSAERFEGSANDPATSGSWSFLSIEAGWDHPSSQESPMWPRARKAFGMVELSGLVRKGSGAGGVISLLPYEMQPHIVGGGGGQALPIFPVVVDTEGVMSFASVALDSDGVLRVSPVPPAGSLVHLTGIRFPGDWYAPPGS